MGGQNDPTYGEQMNFLTLKELSYVVFDLETTGLYPEQGDEIIEIGAVVVENLETSDEIFHSLVNPGKPIPAASTAVHGIKDQDVVKAPSIDKILPKFLQFTGSRIWVAQNARFDLGFVVQKLKQLQMPLKQNIVVDTIGLSRMLFQYENSHNLDKIMARLGIARTGDRHRSIDDSRYTALALIEFIKMLEKQQISTLPQIESAFVKADSLFKTARPKTKSLFA
jgi:DNA polymerase-3 subunit epsilon